MPEAKVTMNVRPASDRASVIEIHGEITAFAEKALMDASSMTKPRVKSREDVKKQLEELGILTTLTKTKKE